MEDRKRLGERLRAARHQRNWTQLEAAKATGISSESIGGYENGREGPSFERVVRMANAYSVALDYLAGIAEHPSGLPLGRKIIDLQVVRGVLDADSLEKVNELQSPSGLSFAVTFPAEPLFASESQVETVRRQLANHIDDLRKLAE